MGLSRLAVVGPAAAHSQHGRDGSCVWIMRMARVNVYSPDDLAARARDGASMSRASPKKRSRRRSRSKTPTGGFTDLRTCPSPIAHDRVIEALDDARDELGAQTGYRCRRTRRLGARRGAGRNRRRRQGARTHARPHSPCPRHLDAEVLSALGRLHRAGELPKNRVAAMLNELAIAPVRRHPLAPLVAGAWERRTSCGVDALCIELASELGSLSLLSTDARLARTSPLGRAGQSIAARIALARPMPEEGLEPPTRGL